MLIKNDVKEIPLLKCEYLLYLYLEYKGFILIRYDGKYYYFFMTDNLVEFIKTDYLMRLYMFIGDKKEQIKRLIWKN